MFYTSNNAKSSNRAPIGDETIFFRMYLLIDIVLNTAGISQYLSNVIFFGEKESQEE